MQNSRLPLTRNIFSCLGSLIVLAFLAGCQAVSLTNLTPPSLPDNPSRIYTITLRVDAKSNQVNPGSMVPHIIIDGQNHVMAKSGSAQGLYEYEYHLPANRSELAYYFLVNYEATYDGRVEARETYSVINRITIASRYVLSLEANRGPVGSRISLLGRGFTPQDVINFEGTPVRTVYDSPTSISFFVPTLPPGRNYQVMLTSGAGQSPAGTFRIDASNLMVSPSSLTMRTGDLQVLTFSIANPAPAGGRLLDVTTDVPESVIMPELIVPAGQTSVSVNVQGGRPGSGSLFLKGYDAGEVTILVTVTAK